MFSADFISGSRDFTPHLTSGELILIHSADACILVQIARARAASLLNRAFNIITDVRANCFCASLLRMQIYMQNVRGLGRVFNRNVSE